MSSCVRVKDKERESKSKRKREREREVDATSFCLNFGLLCFVLSWLSSFAKVFSNHV